MKKIREQIKDIFKSVKTKLFFTISLTIVLIIFFLIIVNNFALEQFYLYSKENTIKSVYNQLNEYYNSPDENKDIESELEKISIKNNFNNGISVYTTNKNFTSGITNMYDIMGKLGINIGEELESNDNFTIKRQRDSKNGLAYIMLSGRLDNGYFLYVRIPITSIQDSVNISNNFLILIAGIAILISAIMVSIISKKFTEPITELNNIAKKMANLDFSQKYQVSNTDDEINTLGKSINIMSEKLEGTIKQLRNSNIELERDIEEKSKIDEMRKSFISDVSHELKTPIALIQGYAEGLVENVNSDGESRKFYAEVILDEANRMDKLVKQLLELMKLEYGKREFNNQEIDIVEITKEVIRKCNVMLKENNIEVEFENKEPIYVFADEFYIEQVITNYFTNAIKHCDEINGKKKITVKIEENNNNKVHFSIFNTGENIAEEDLDRIWVRFYKVDSSRNREAGGSGIGLALVKAIMNNYDCKYGVDNKENGVEFYFELNQLQENT